MAATLAEPASPRAATRCGSTSDTLLVGIGYRTNPAASCCAWRRVPGVDVVAFDLPHWNGRGEVMHLMTFISPLDRDLALVYPRIAPVRLLELLAERGIRIVEVPDEEFETQGRTCSRSGPRRALALDGNPRRAARMERAGVDVSSTAARRSRRRATAARPA
jgi:N-dimethylarginine dimethylaminohydrolase